MFRDVFCSLPSFQIIQCTQMTYKDLIFRVDFWDNNDISRSSGLNNQYVAKSRPLEADDSMGYGTNMII